MRLLYVRCDGCGATTYTRDGTWPVGWYLWLGRDYCHACAVPHILSSWVGRWPPARSPHKPQVRYEP